MPTGVLVVAQGPTSGERQLLRFGWEGEPDTTFNTNAATALMGFSTEPGISFDLDSSNRILLSGVQNQIIRLTPEGQRDTTFGTNGVLTIPSVVPGMSVGQTFTVYGVKSAGSSLLLTGALASGSTASAWLVTRSDLAGVIDATFNNQGYAVLGTGLAAGREYQPLFHVTADGTIFVLGRDASTKATLIAKLNGGGQPDASFGMSGVLTLATQGVIYALTSDSTGRLLLAGTASGSGYVARLLVSGTLDGSFGTAGEVRIKFTDHLRLSLAWQTAYNRIWPQPDGRIRLGGTMYAQSASGLGSKVPGYQIISGLLENGSEDPAYVTTAEKSALRTGIDLYSTTVTDDLGHDNVLAVAPTGQTVAVGGGSTSWKCGNKGELNTFCFSRWK